MNVVAVKITKDNKVDITLEELNKMLEKAYEQGFEVGKECGKNYTYPNVPPLTTPSYPSYPQSPTTPITPISPIWYCGACKDSSGTIGVDCNKVVGKIDPKTITGVSGPHSSFSEVNL